MINDKTVEMICSSDREVRELGAQLILNNYTDVEILMRDLDNYILPNKDKYFVERTKGWVGKKVFDIYYYQYIIGYDRYKDPKNFHYNITAFTNNNPERKLTWMTG